MFRIPAFFIGAAFGCLPFAALFAYAFSHSNIQKMGSGNPGTTNVIRSVGIVPGLLTFVFDCAKTVAAVLIVQHFFSNSGIIWAGAGAVIGHDFSPFLRFKGGKGVAVTIALIALLDLRLLIALVPAVAAALLTKRMAVGSVALACVLPFAAAVFGCGAETTSILSFLGILMLARHKSNFNKPGE